MMKLKVSYGLLIILLTFFYGCKKEDTVPAPVADFTYQVNGFEVTFNSTTTNNPTELNWQFGDGETATGDNVVHTFAGEGDFTVSLTAKNEGGTNTASRVVSLKQQYKIIEIETSFGNMYMWLYNETPLHRDNFLKLASEGFYNGTTFHRVIQNFMIQGGDPNSKDSDPTNDGTGGPGYTIPAEINATLKHTYGAVGAARTDNPAKASSGSQFYIVNNVNGTPHLDNNYTVFGKIIKGVEHAVTIAKQPKDNKDRPLTNITKQVKVLEKTRDELKTEFNFEP